ncbi:MAG: ADP-ribosylglycohydrolase family protein [Clostridium sp.]|nr:ADP-ribosylglycohydrolase family protein [Clostridium sp.]MDY5896569.1 ADP-ribosylglycohydrolase family protein [Oscillospiraceae bacterium]
MTIDRIIRSARINAGLTVKAAAEKCGVAEQLMQAWECGVAEPTNEQLAALRGVLDMGGCGVPQPDIPEIDSGESYSAQLMTEYKQCMDEGLDITEYEELFKAAARLPMNEAREHIADTIYSAVASATVRSDYEYCEPERLCDIKRCREKAPVKKTPDPAALEGKIIGAWYGRICGCLLGKAFEGIRTEELIPVLKATGNYPMHRYVLRGDLTDEMIEKTQFCLDNGSHIDELDHVPSDDDTNYMVLYQELIAKYGRGFTSRDVMNFWLSRQARYAYFTAERVAFDNAVKGFAPPDTGRYKNPYREWIGAQIRADYFGYINPGDPEAAADMAYRDAVVSHVKNGVYGEMYFAALIAAAAVESDMRKAIISALATIPQKSRFYANVMQIVRQFDGGVAEEECFAGIHERWDEHDGHGWCHVLSNAQIVIASLLYGGGDYGKTICRAVQTGFDTDCNAATAGSVLGMMNGIGSIGDEWTAPINGRLDTQIFGVGTVNIDDRAALTLEHIKKA